jgi:hypothetical protein
VIPQLSEWESYYVIVGSSAAALTGLMFVVITLIADSDVPGSSRTISAFGTPTILHFCEALIVSATLSAPWRSLTGVAIAMGVYGVAGMVYTLVVVRRARRQTEYQPVLEDWLWHTIFPAAAYAAITSGAVLLHKSPEEALFDVAGGVLALVLIGIHNAWDTVTYLAIGRKEDPQHKG